MSLFGIALKNIKRNLNNYFLYFISMVFSIMIYFTFSSIQYNQQVIDLTNTYLKINTVFKVCSIIIAVFTAMFIWYSNSFFIRKRKKEVALYCLMGVKKSQVATMLFYENLVMGVMALIAGMLVGSLFSRIFAMILVKLMGFEIKITLSIPFEAVVSTVLVFMFLFTITSLHGYSLIYRFQLVELFSAEKTGQKQPGASFAMALLSILFLGAGYYLAMNFNADNPTGFLIDSLIILLFTVLGTYMFFSSLIVFAVKLSKKDKSRQYRGLNMIGTSQLMYRIKSNSKLLATIAVLSATTLTAMGGATAFYYDQVNSITKMLPFSFVYPVKDISVDLKIEQAIARHPENKLKNFLEIEFANIEGNYPNVSRLIGKPTDYEKGKDNVISESTLKKVLAARGMNIDVSLEKNEVLMYFYTMYTEKYMINPKGKTMYYILDNKEVPFVIKDCINYPLTNRLALGSPSIVNVIVVKDEIYEKLAANSPVIKLKAINIENSKKSKKVNDEVLKILRNSNLYGRGVLPVSAYYDYYAEMMSKMGILVFLAFFMGMVFLICTGSMIFFKQLSEANDDRDRYDILKKIGVNKSQIRRSIAKQMLFMFALPLIIGVSHSLMAIQILQPFMKLNVIYPAIATIVIYTLIYLGYYFLTVSCYNRFVNEKV